MAIAYVNSGTGTADFASTLTFSFDAGTAADRLLLVYAMTDRGGSDTINTATYNGVSMSAEAGLIAPASYWDGRLFYLVAPASGANDVAIQYSSSNIKPKAIAICYSGVNQSVPYDGYAEYKYTTSGGTSPSTTVASEASDLALVLGGISYTGTTGFTPGSGVNERVDAVIASVYSALAYDKAGETTATLNGTLASTAEFWGVKLNLNIAAGGNAKRALLLGVG